MQMSAEKNRLMKSDALPDLWTASLKWMEALMVNNQLPFSGNVTQWIDVWGRAVNQIGLFNISLDNSADPELEEEIYQDYSYGRQLGRILDVLAPIVAAQKEQLLQKDAVSARKLADFEEMVSDIQIAKSERHLSATEIVEALNELRNGAASQLKDKVEKIDQSLAELRTALGKS
jgi:hypothetical protein